MVYLHPNYKLGLLMFNYNFSNFAGTNNPNNPATNTTANGVKSIYDEPITNANYLMLGTTLTADKWRFSGTFVTANACAVGSTPVTSIRPSCSMWCSTVPSWVANAAFSSGVSARRASFAT